MIPEKPETVPLRSRDLPVEPVVAPAPVPEVDTGGTTVGTAATGLRHRGGRKPPLFVAGVIGLVIALCYYGYTAEVTDPAHLAYGLLIMFLAMLPSLRWALQSDYRFPVFEVFMLTGINTYAIPLLAGHQQLQFFEDQAISTAALGVLLYQITANLTYILVKGRPKRGRAWTEEVISSNISKYLSYAMAITAFYTMISAFTTWLPPSINGIIRAGAFGVGIIATFIQSRLWGQGLLPHHSKGAFLFLLAAQVIFSWSELFLVGGISILVLAVLGYVSGSKKLPVLALLIVVPVVAILHNGKSVMRAKYWDGGAPKPAIIDLPAYYSEWIGYGVDPEMYAQRKEQNNLLLERTSLFHIFCMVTANTPERLPFLNGETYTYVPAQFVPRYFWPNKPRSHIATYRLSTYYGLQGEEDTQRTTIAFGMLSEAYANFGFFGTTLLGFVFAFCFKKISEWASLSPLLSYPGLFLIVLMAWAFQTELTLAAWLSAFYQACIAVIGVPFMMRNFFGR